MATLTTKQLLEITPLTEEVKKQALEKLPAMNADEIFGLEQICWESIMEVCKLKARAKLEDEILKTSQEGRPEKIDTKAIQEDVLNELMAKIETIHTAAELEKVKQMLYEHMPQKYPQPAKQVKNN